MAINYKLIKIEGFNAYFSRDHGWLAELIFGAPKQLTPLDEDKCRILHKESITPGMTGVHTPTPKTRGELKNGFYAIRDEKRRAGVSFACQDDIDVPYPK